MAATLHTFASGAELAEKLATAVAEKLIAGIAARGAGTRMCEVAESEGYSNDICAYARVSLAYAKLKSCPEQDVAMPDVLLCCSNICSCMIKWYENLARELNIPMILLDIPFNPDYEVSDAEVAYVTGQFWDAVKQLEEITGSYPGVEKSYAIQAGREVRVMVKPEQVSEDQMVILARELAKRIENELEYPGQIKVHVLRETKVVEYAK